MYLKGTDPEFFITDARGEYISMIPYIAGTKDSPEFLPSGATIQQDNVALEFATAPKLTTQDFIGHIRKVFIDVLNYIPDSFNINFKPSANFNESELSHPDAKEFACDPDYNAWTIERNPKPKDADKNTLRSCGAHLHTGVWYENYPFLKDYEGKLTTVRCQDVLLGIPSLLLDDSEESVRRRKLYGKAGAHRCTSYGVEYRVLSNFWLKSPKLVKLICSLNEEALQIINNKKIEALMKDVFDHKAVQDIINHNMRGVARKIIDKVLPKYVSDEVLDMLYNCIEIRNTYNWKEEWGIK